MRNIFSTIEEHKKEELIFFLFANRGYYLTESLICLNLKKFIYEQLKEIGTERIYYVSCNSNEAYIEVLDTVSKNGFRARKSFGFISGYKDFKTDISTNISRWEFTIQDFWKYGVQRLKHVSRDRMKNTAIVFEDMQDFYEILNYDQNKEGILFNLLQKQAEYLKENGNQIVLISTGQEKELVKYIGTEDNYIVRLCPHLKEVMNRPSIYTALYDTAKLQCGFLCEMSIERIQDILKRFLLFEQGVLEFSKELLSDMSLFIYYWYHSTTLRKEFSGILPMNPNGSTRILEEFLKNEGYKSENGDNWLNLYNKGLMVLKKRNEENESFELFLKKSYPDCTRLIVVENGEIISLLRRIENVSDNTQKTRINELINRFHRLNVRNLDEKMEELFLILMGSMSNALEYHDDRTLEKCIEVLELCEKQQMVYDPEYADNWNMWRLILSVSETLFDTECSVKKREEIIQKSRQDYNEAMNLVKSLPDSDYRVGIQKEKALRADENIRKNEILIQNSERYIGALKIQLSDMEECARNYSRVKQQEMKDRHQEYLKILMGYKENLEEENQWIDNVEKEEL